MSEVKMAFWMKYPKDGDRGGYEHYAVIAESLDEAFKKMVAYSGKEKTSIRYLNRQIDVLE